MTPRQRPLAWVVLLAICLGGCARQGAPDTTASAAAPERIVTLAPHLAELVYAAGAGDKLVGVSAYSDHPPEVAGLPRIGDAFVVDQEQLALLEPDVVLAWQSGTPAHVVDELRAQDHRVEVIRTRGLDDIPAALERIGALAGTDAASATAATSFTDGIEALADRGSGAAPIRVFYQVSQRPVYTINGDHYVSDLIRLCGGENVFADLETLAPVVTEEAVLDRDPEVLLAPGLPGADAFANWTRWSTLAANRYGNHHFVPGDLIGRASPRLLEAGRAVCDVLEEGRKRRQEVRSRGSGPAALERADATRTIRRARLADRRRAS